ncbi:MAG: DNA polymerase III subunit delta [Patescibacteria group bacterium]|jgi:DNA polymerase-3 subunit delta
MIIFAYGADSFRSRRFVKELKNKFTDNVDPDATSLDIIDGQTATLKEVADKITTGSLFVKKRLVIVNNIFKNKKEKIFSDLLNYLKTFTDDQENIIIFRNEDGEKELGSLKADAKKLHDFLKKQQYSQEFKSLDNGQLLSFIKKEMASYGKEISAPAASLLIALTDGDLWQIAGEIRKLSSRTNEDKISTEEVKEMVAGSFNENIFALTDAISAKNKNRAISLLEEQYAAGLSDEYLITMFIRQFKILLQIRAALDNNLNPEKIKESLKLHPFVIKKGIGQAANFSPLTLKKFLNQLVYLDFMNKTGQGNIKTELTLLISDL